MAPCACWTTWASRRHTSKESRWVVSSGRRWPAGFPSSCGAWCWVCRPPVVPAPPTLTPETSWRQGCAALLDDTSTRLDQIQPPTLIVHGDRAALVPVRNARLLHRGIPQSALLFLPGGSPPARLRRPHRHSTVHPRRAAAPRPSPLADATGSNADSKHTTARWRCPWRSVRRVHHRAPRLLKPPSPPTDPLKHLRRPNTTTSAPVATKGSTGGSAFSWLGQHRQPRMCARRRRRPVAAASRSGVPRERMTR